jgi:hypothetical protein
MNMKYIISALLFASATSAFAEESVISASKGRDAQVVGVIDPSSSNSIKLLADKKVIWNCGLSWGYPSSSIILWSQFSTKVAISVRTTKTSSEIHIVDIYGKLKELPMPDISKLILDLNSNISGRFLNVSPLGWSDEDTIILLAQGNLVDSLSDGSETLNFKYLITIQLSTRRVLSVLCLSQHDLNDKSIKQGSASSP